MNFSETNLTENLPHSGEEVYATYSRLHTGFAIVRPPETSRDDGAYVDDSVLRSAQIEQLYSHASSGIYGAFIADILIVLCFWNLASHTLLLVWFACIAPIYVFRQVLIIKFARSKIAGSEALDWERPFAFLTAAAGLFWGVAGVLFFPGTSAVHQALLMIILAGLCSGVLAVYSTLKSVYLPFLLLEGLPVISRLLYEQTPTLVTAGIIVAAYLAVLIVTGGRMNAACTQFLRVRFLKDHLIEFLGHEKKQVESLYEAMKEQTAQKDRAATALLESEAKYRDLVEKANNTIFSTDSSGNFTYVNPALERISGYAKEELIGVHYLELIPPESREMIRRHYRTQYAEKTPDTYFEFPFVSKEGKNLWLGQVVRLLTEGDSVAGFHAIGRDITDRKHAEKALGESQERLELALRGADLGLWDYNLKTKEVFFDKRGSAMAGYSIHDQWIHVDGWRKKVHPDDLDRVIKAFNDHVQGHTCFYESEHRLRHKSGEYVWVSVRAKVVERDEHGQPLRVVGTCLDVTDRRRGDEALQSARNELETRVDQRTAELRHINDQRRKYIRDRERAERALRESEEKYRALFEDSMDAVFITTREGILVDANQAFLDMFGLTREGTRNMEMFQIYSDHVERKLLQHEIEQRGSLKDYELIFHKTDGTKIEALLSSTVRRDNNRTIVGYQGIIRDVTNFKQIQKQLLHAQKMEPWGFWAGGIAHDFNNLLQAVLGYSDLLLRRKNANDPDRKHLETIRQTARDGADLVSRILAMSMKAELKVCPTDLNKEIRRVEKLLRRTIPRMIKINLMLADDLRLIEADPAQMEQVILNLGINAQHAMPDGGRLLMQTSNVLLSHEYAKAHAGPKPGHYVLLSITDNGTGMPQEVQDRIFEPFFTTKTGGKGTGLGLSIVHGIVTRHGGYISCYSEPGKGTSFKIYFPVSENRKLADPARTLEMPEFGTETILLVDDDDRIRDIGRHRIEMGGYNIITACSGEEALSVYTSQKDKISLVILDLIMPGMGGKRCLEELIKIDPEVKVLVSSGYPEAGLAGDAQYNGARGFVSKPYDAKEILTMIRKVLDNDHL